jgi:hypothetical protein
MCGPQNSAGRLLLEAEVCNCGSRGGERGKEKERERERESLSGTIYSH